MTTISGKKKERTVSASAFKATCLELMNRVQSNGIVVRVTKHGKPVARLVPVDDDESPLFGSAPVRIRGDIVSPTGERWEANE